MVPSTFTSVQKGDYTVTPFTVHKDFSITSGSASGSGYTVRQGFYQKKPLAISASINSVVNASQNGDGSYKVIVWRSLNQIYYRNPYAPIEGSEGFTQGRTSKQLFLTASMISAPYLDFGEEIKPSSLTLSCSSYYLQDDGSNNLYDTEFSTDNFLDSSSLDLHLGFENLFQYTDRGTGAIAHCLFNFKSNTFNADDYICEGTNLNLLTGVEVAGTGSGASIGFKQDLSSIQIRHSEKFNYERDEDFLLSFWVSIPPSQSNQDTTENIILSKRSYVDVSRVGTFSVLQENGTLVNRNFVSTSAELSPINIYPYEFSTYNESAGSSKGKVSFKRSDGISTLLFTSSAALNDGAFHNVCATKSGSLIYFYIDGNLQDSGSDVGEEPSNDYYILIGAEDKNGTNQFSGSFDELRMYTATASGSLISSSLAEKELGYLYQTQNVGNVFYKRGEATITSPIRKYHDYFNTDNWTLTYKNTYTIWEYEVLCRIRSGQYNKTMNPTSTQSAKSNLYLDAFTGSLSPYATTVGLYNDKMELVAIGKFGRPLKMRDDVDINVLVKFDY